MGIGKISTGCCFCSYWLSLENYNKGFTNEHPNQKHSHQVKVGWPESVVPGGCGLIHHPEVSGQVEVPRRFSQIEPNWENNSRLLTERCTRLIAHELTRCRNKRKEKAAYSTGEFIFYTIYTWSESVLELFFYMRENVHSPLVPYGVREGWSILGSWHNCYHYQQWSLDGICCGLLGCHSSQEFSWQRSDI